LRVKDENKDPVRLSKASNNDILWTWSYTDNENEKMHCLKPVPSRCRCSTSRFNYNRPYPLYDNNKQTYCQILFRNDTLSHQCIFIRLYDILVNHIMTLFFSTEFDKIIIITPLRGSFT
jgi:hypothetical protein